MRGSGSLEVFIFFPAARVFLFEAVLEAGLEADFLEAEEAGALSKVGAFSEAEGITEAEGTAVDLRVCCRDDMGVVMLPEIICVVWFLFEGFNNK